MTRYMLNSQGHLVQAPRGHLCEYGEARRLLRAAAEIIERQNHILQHESAAKFLIELRNERIEEV